MKRKSRFVTLLAAKPWYKTIKMMQGADVVEKIGRYNRSSAVLFDTGDSNLAGGTGNI